MRLLTALGAATFLVAACHAQPEPGEGVGHSESALSADQCSYFAVNGKVTICHATGSAKNPVVMLKVAEKACINGHAGHEGDWIAVDGDCGANACLPETAPCDASLPCCDGLSCEAGVCVGGGDPCANDPCGANATCSESTDPLGYTCSCEPGYSGDPATGCSDIDECAVDNGGCPDTVSSTFDVSPIQSLHWPAGGGPLMVNIAELGIAPGDRVKLEMVGDYDYVGVEGEGILSGVFIDPTSGPVDAGVDVDTTQFGLFDIAEDFLISYVINRGGDGNANFNGVEIEVPPGAGLLFVSLLDHDYTDNPPTDDDLGVRITKLGTCVNTPGSFYCE